MNTQMFIRGWLVYELTGSYKALAIMSLANGLVGLLLAPVGGVIADRVRQKKHVIQLCQGVNTAAALVIAWLIGTGLIRFEHLVIAAVFQGGVMNVMMPSRQALMPEVVGMDRLMNAIALSTSGMNVARLFMPGFAGWVVGALGGGNGNVLPAQWVYLMMGGLYAWAIVGLVPVRLKDRQQPEGGAPPPFRELRLGFRYVFQTPVIRMLLGCNFFMVFFGMTYFMLLPGFAKDVLNAGPSRLGLLMSISGVGALIGSLIIASLPNQRRGLLLLLSTLLLAVGLIGFSLSTHYWLSVGLLALVGFGQAGRMSLSNVLIQAYVDDDYRGRVMSIYMLEFALLGISIYPIGLLANAMGPQIAVGGAGCALLIFALGLLLFVPSYRNLE
jgi:MFS family permease